MNSSKHGKKNWLIASLILESSRDIQLSGPRPSEEEIVAWAEGMLEGNRESTVLHWVVHDPQCSQLYQSYLEFAFEPEFASEEVLVADYKINEQRVNGTSRDSLPGSNRTPIRARICKWWTQLIPFPAAVAGVVTLFILVPLLVTRNAPVTPADFLNRVSNPAANWQFIAAVEPTGRSPQVSAQADDKQALRFGVRTLISELGITHHPDVRAYYDTLPLEYPFCASNEDSCEETYRFYYELGRWVTLTERICRASLSNGDLASMLSKQVSAYTKLLTLLNTESLSIDSQLKSILDAPQETACWRADWIYKWSQP